MRLTAVSFHIGETVVLSLKEGHPRQVANVVDAKTGGSS